MSRYDADDTYCLPGSSVLKNKAGISDQDLLDQTAEFNVYSCPSSQKTPALY